MNNFEIVNEYGYKEDYSYLNEVFDNTLDKLNFLRQYLGNFKGVYEDEEHVYKKRFTK